jgi:dTDP-4-amino-4,6-dideoxygalactose transaminase
MPSMTFAASANAVRYTGAEAVFVDSRPEDGNLDVELLLEALDILVDEGADIAAVMSVDLFMRCVEYTALLSGLQGRGIPLIEDAAEALGASHRGRAAGSFGQSGVLSFNGNKVLTTAGGGMLVSDDGDLIEHARYLASQARQPVRWYEHTEIGYNYRMSNVLGALGLGKLESWTE